MGWVEEQGQINVKKNRWVEEQETQLTGWVEEQGKTNVKTLVGLKDKKHS